MKLSFNTTSKQAIPVLLIVLGCTARLLPHPANVAPISAIALFSGLYLQKRFAVLLPLVGLFLSDIVLGFYDWKIMIAVYGSVLFMASIGIVLKQRKTIVNLIGSTLLGSVVFFLVTNAAVWMFGTLYPHTTAGLISSYTMAIPFFRNSIVGDMFYTTILVGGYEIIQYFLNKKIAPAQHLT